MNFNILIAIYTYKVETSFQMVFKDILLVILTYYKKQNQNKKVLRDFITKGVHSHGKIASHADVLRVCLEGYSQNSD